MKANAPEKIYVHRTVHLGLLAASEINITGNDVEYTRTDAFIEKVKNFLNKKDDRDSYTIGYIKRHLEEIIKEIGL